MGAHDEGGPRDRVGCYPGSFNPPTVAHLAVAEAARRTGALDRVDLVLSQVALGKEDLVAPTIDQRATVLRSVAAGRPWLGVAVRQERLVADLAEGYDAVVVGADKWRQVVDPAWYGDDPAARDAAVARLPLVLVAPRSGDHLEDLAERPGVVVLDLDPAHHRVSASAVRTGHPDAGGWVLPEALAAGHWPTA